ncbi:pkd2 [Symbiodinium natans]|uniref:Pkd2 protein n=1 Tax=Symbiodinium natans TaxID=878477 RepID=A0A812SA98_9DINO|nr:pkd2 [Symbiodinium natans]
MVVWTAASTKAHVAKDKVRLQWTIPGVSMLDGKPHMVHAILDNLSENGDVLSPFHSKFGNGQEFSEDELQALRTATTEAMYETLLKPGDVLVLDNFRWAHGRQPFVGKREHGIAISGHMPRVPGTLPPFIGLWGVCFHDAVSVDPDQCPIAMLATETFKDRVLQCQVWDKVKEGLDIRLFYSFGVYGTIESQELVKLCALDGLGLTAQDVKDWIKDSDLEGLGEVSVEDVHRGLTRGSVAFTLVKKTLFGQEKDHKSTECSLTELLDWLKYEYDKKSNLWSLPETLLLFFTFVASAAVHLGVFEAFRISQVFDAGLGFGDFLAYDTVDIETFWIWLERGFFRNIFRHDLFSFVRQYRYGGNYGEDPVVTAPFPGRVFRENQIIGAARLRKWVTEQQACDIGDFWKAIYPTCHQQGPRRPEDWYMFYHQKREVLEDQLHQFRDIAWVNADSPILDVQIFTFNAHQVAFTLQNLRMEWSPAGFLIQRPGMRETFYGAPYYNLALVLPDLMFLALLTSIMHSELKEAIPAAMNGLDGIKDYLKFWNVVDWINVTVGIACVSVWLVFVVKVTVDLRDVLAGMPSDLLDLAVFTNRSYLSYEEFNNLVDRQDFERKMSEVLTTAEETAYLYTLVRSLLFFYLFVLMFKFFKAFRANDRLDVVIQTITDSATDVLHFAIAFLLVFLCFASAGMVLFGYTVEGFHTFVYSVFFCWRAGVGMADIEVYEIWYQVLAYFWHFTYLALMSILMINILVGLIFEAYGRIHANAGEPPTLLEQVSDAVDTLKDTKAFINMWYIICELEDDDFPAHPAELVTVRSLKKAFSKDRMTKQNAEYLIENASSYAKKQAKKINLSVSDGVRMIGQTRTNANKLLALSEQVSEMLRKFHLKHAESPQEDWLKALGGTTPGATPQGHRVAQSDLKQPGVLDALESTNRPTTSAASHRDKKSREELLLENMRALTSELVKKGKEQHRLTGFIAETIENRQDAIQEKDAWGRQKTVVLTDRCEKIEISIGKLGECLKGVDPTQLRGMPEKLQVVAEKVRTIQQEDSSPTSCDKADHMSMLQNQLASIHEDVAKVATHMRAKVNVPLALMHMDHFFIQANAEKANIGDPKALSRSVSQARSFTGTSRSNFSSESSDLSEEHR